MLTGLLKLQKDDINPCKDTDLLSCTPASVDLSRLDHSSVLLPEGLLLEKKKSFHDGMTSFAMFSDDFDNEAFFSYRNERVMGKVRMNDRSMFFIEPCNNWEGCHVWKKISQDTFVDETHEVSVDEEKLSQSQLERNAELINKGKTEDKAVAEYTLMLYYTRDFAAHTDDIELFMDTLIGDMNFGYENSDIPEKVKLHCVEAADLDDEDESSDMLHKLNAYKPSYGEIRY